MASTKICSKCNTENPQRANYCRACGSKFDNSPEIESFNYVSIPHIGDSVELTWSIKNADTAFLNGQTMPLSHRYKVVVDKEIFWNLLLQDQERESPKEYTLCQFLHRIRLPNLLPHH